MNKSLKHITIVGSGNVASFMGELFYINGCSVDLIISRNAATGEALAKTLETHFSIDFIIPSTTQLVLICVNDDEVATVANALPIGDYAVCHCAGSLSAELLAKHEIHGVMYPLQSIGPFTDVSGVEVPFLLEASQEELQLKLEDLVDRCGKTSRQVDGGQRLQYHLAAVFANNFTNAMMVASEDISQQFKLDFKLLKPLLTETFQRIDSHSPAEVQTGPAKRHDNISMERHRQLMLDHPALSALYTAVSEYIGSRWKKD